MDSNGVSGARYFTIQYFRLFMSRIFVIFFLIYYSFGTVAFPMGDLSYIKDLPQMYRQCAGEDPDMDLCDFLFEHLLNMGTDSEPGNHERPHQAVFGHMPIHVLIAFSAPCNALIAIETADYGISRYPAARNNGDLQSFSSSIFRPPVHLVCV